MVSRTSNEGYPYPLPTDLADMAVDLAGFAQANDSEPAAWVTGWAAATHAPTFLAHTTGAGSNVSAYSSQLVTFNTVDFVNVTQNPALYDTGTGLFNQPATQAQSWWYFGGLLIVNPTGGTTTVGSIIKAYWVGQTIDPLTTVNSQVYVAGESVESNTSGEYIGFHGIVKLYQGYMNLRWAHADSGSGAVKAYQANSLLWGTWLGYA